MSKISVIMPSLNVAPYIGECLDSVLAQTGCELQILAIDAGSTDGTEEIIREYAKKNEQICVVHSDIKSYGHQINVGLEMADGDYISILETDDALPQDIYSKMIAIMEGNQELDFVKGNVLSFREKRGSVTYGPKESSPVKLYILKMILLFFWETHIYGGDCIGELLRRISGSMRRPERHTRMLVFYYSLYMHQKTQCILMT